MCYNNKDTQQLHLQDKYDSRDCTPATPEAFWYAQSLDAQHCKRRMFNCQQAQANEVFAKCYTPACLWSMFLFFFFCFLW